LIIEEDVKAARMALFRFFGQVRKEIARVTWPSRNETTVTTILVLILATLAALFFIAVDFVFRNLMGFLLGINLG
jgi:preprotein translocase subunit SecE